MNRKENPVTISCADIAILDQDVLGVLEEMRGFEDAYSWGTVGFERSWGELWISEPGKIAAVELDVFSGDRECVVLGMGEIERDLCGLDLVDDVKGASMRNETDNWLPPVTGWTAKAASQHWESW